MLNSSAQAPLAGRPLCQVALAMASGIVVAEYLRPPLAAALILLAAAMALAVICLLSEKLNRIPHSAVYRRAALLLCCGALGFFLCAGQRAALDAWDYRDGQYLTVQGRVSGAAELREQGRYRLLLDIMAVDGEPYQGAPVYIYGQGAPPLSGSVVEVIGQCLRSTAAGNPNAFDYQLWLERQGIAGVVSAYYNGEVTVMESGPSFSPAELGGWLRSLLNEAAEGLNERQRALVLGVFLGDKSGLDHQMRNALGLTGMLHAFAVSGLHVGYIVAMALLLAGRGYGKRLPRLLLTVIMLLVYILLTGASASILRASLMAMTLLLAGLFREMNDTPSALALSALLCLCFKPLWLFDPGFQLSYGASLGIVIYYPLLLPKFRRLPDFLARIYTVTLSATLFTLPLICYYYWHIAWLGWLLAPLVMWLVGASVMLSFCATVAAVFWPQAAALLLKVAGGLMEMLYSVAAWVAALPGAATVSGSMPLMYIATFVAALLLLPLVNTLRRGRGLGLMLIALTLAFSLLPGLWQSLSRDDEVLAEAVFIDVGQGDAALIMDNEGLTVLIDGGGGYTEGAVGEYILLPYLKSRGITDIDVMISSHPDRDHTDGLLSVLENMPVGALFYAGCHDDHQLQRELLSAAAANGAELIEAAAGDGYRLGHTLQLHFYHPPDGYLPEDDNEASLVCELSCGETDILFTGDAGGPLLRELAQRYDIETEIIKLPHHGAKGGYDEDFYAMTNAETAIISVGADNSYGHPAPVVVEYWQEQGALYRTDRQGAITLLLQKRGYQALYGE